MKMSEAKNPVFTQAWWSKHKATTLKSTGFGKALKEYEDACKGPKDKADTYREIFTALEGVKSASAVALKACNKTLHKETIEALENYRRKAEAAVKALRPIMSALGEIDKIKKPADAMKHKAFEDFSKAIHGEENYYFLKLMAQSGNRGDQRVYDMFIKQGAKYELTLDNQPLTNQFQEIDEAPSPKNWDAAPWDKAVAEVEGMVQGVIAQFCKWFVQETTKEALRGLP